MSIKNKLILYRYKNQNILLLEKDQEPNNYILFDTKSSYFNIIRAQVTSFEASLGMYFVEFQDNGQKKYAILNSKTKVKERIKYNIGDKLLVQLIKEQNTNKYSTVSNNIVLPGLFCNYKIMPNNNGNILKVVNQKLIKFGYMVEQIKSCVPQHENLSITIELLTNINNDEDLSKLLLEVKIKTNIFSHIMSSYKQIYSNSTIYKFNQALLCLYREKLETDATYEVVCNNFDLLLELKSNFTEHTPFIKYDFKKQLTESHYKHLVIFVDQCLDTTIEISNTINIMVHQAEACTLIDVNFKGAGVRNNYQKMNLEVNLMVVDKLVLTVKEQNISGQILIDFIKVNNQSSRDQIIDRFKSIMNKYNIMGNVLGFSRLGILEVVITRLRPCFMEIFTDKCNTCDFNGKVHNLKYIFFKAWLEVELLIASCSLSTINVKTNNTLIQKFITFNKDEIQELNNRGYMLEYLIDDTVCNNIVIY